MTNDETRLEQLRHFYAELVTAPISAMVPGLLSAFGATPRERFLGPGPWDVFVGGGRYITTPNDDPAFVYQDVVVRLRDQINNGQPSLHANCLAALGLGAGDTVVHIGAGTGYYSAVLARLVGRSGRVHAFELDAELAGRAGHNLSGLTQVTVWSRSGVDTNLPAADAIYVNAGVTQPVREWLAALKAGGRLLFPLTSSGPGAMLFVTKAEDAQGAFAARFISAAMFIPCVGARDDQTAARLTHAFSRGDAAQVRALHLNTSPDDSSWFAGDGWWLSTRPDRGAS